MRSRNPLVVEAARVYFRSWRLLLTYQLYVALLAVILVFSWPKDHYFYFVQFDKTPATYSVVVVSLLLILAVMSTHFGGDGIGRREIHPLDDWLRYTGVSVVGILQGKLFFAAIHTLLLALLAVPCLVVAASPSGIPMKAIPLSMLVISVCSLTYRAIALLVTVVLEGYPFAVFLVRWSASGFLLFGTLTVFPRANPLQALLRLTASGDRAWSFSLFVHTLVVHAVLLAVVTLVSLVALGIQRVRVRTSEEGAV